MDGMVTRRNRTQDKTKDCHQEKDPGSVKEDK